MSQTTRDPQNELTAYKAVRAKACAANSGTGDLHLPDPDAPEYTPVCQVTNTHDETEWIDKPLSVYPPVWREFCNWCEPLIKEQGNDYVVYVVE